MIEEAKQVRRELESYIYLSNRLGKLNRELEEIQYRLEGLHSPTTDEPSAHASWKPSINYNLLERKKSLVTIVNDINAQIKRLDAMIDCCKDKVILTMAYKYGLTMREIANKLAYSETIIYKKIYKACEEIAKENI